MVNLSELERGALVAMSAAFTLGCFTGCTFALAYTCGVICSILTGIFVQLQIMDRHGMRLTWFDTLCIMLHVIGGALFAPVGACITLR